MTWGVDIAASRKRREQKAGLGRGLRPARKADEMNGGGIGRLP